MARLPEIIRRNPLSQVAPTPKASGQGFAALADIMGSAVDFIKPAVEQEVKMEGQRAVYRDEKGELHVDEKSIFAGEMGAIHNAAAFSKYLSQKGIDISQTMTELSVKYEYDPEGFKQAADGYIDILRQDENVPDVLREDIIGEAQQAVQRQFNGIYRNQVKREQSATDTTTATRRDLLAEDYTALIVAGEVEEAERVWKQIEDISRLRENTPFINETEVEREAYLRGIKGNAAYESALRRLDDMDPGDEVSEDFQEELRALSESPSLSPKQRQMVNTLTKGRIKAFEAHKVIRELTDTDFGSQVTRVLEQAAVGGAAARGDSFTGLDADFAKGVSQLVQDAQAAGIPLQITSAYRSEGTQARIVADNMAKHGFSAEDRAAWEADVAELGPVAAGQKWRSQMQAAGLTKWVAMPGTSAHQSGKAVDFAVNGRLIRDPNSRAARWIKENAGKYGLDVPMSWEPWEVRPGGIGAPSETDRLRNQKVLTDAKIPITNGNEFLATIMGADGAVTMLQADPTAAATDFLPKNVVAQFPELADMTAHEAKVWAERKMTMKTTDLAAQRIQIDQIEDEEVRTQALKLLNDRITERRNVEDAAYNEYQERMLNGDPTLTRQSVLEDHDLSNDDQGRLINAIESAQKKTADLSEFLAAGAAGDSVDMMDSKNQKLLDDLRVATAGEGNPFDSQEGTAFEFSAAKVYKTVSRGAFNAIRAGLRSNDPAVVGNMLEMAGQLSQFGDNIFATYSGRKEVLDALADYQFYTGNGMYQAEAAEQISKNREEKPKNLTTEAKKVVADLRESDLLNHFDESIWSDPTIGVEGGESIAALSPAVQREEMMGTFSRLVSDAFLDTGDKELAVNRALTTMDRIYGPNKVSGSLRLMKYPPNLVYPPVGGSHEWMQTALVNDVNAALEIPEDPADREVWQMLYQPSERISADRIKLVSDATTAREVMSGRPASYVVYYADSDGTLHQLPMRYDFDVQAARDGAREQFGAQRAEQMQQFDQDQAEQQRVFEQQQELTGGILDRFDGE